jgi:hypothetical protein
MGESIRETGRRRARLAAVAVGASGVFGVGAIAAAVYVPAAVPGVTNPGVTDPGGSGSSDDSGQGGVSGQDGSGTTGGPLDSGGVRHGRHQQYQSGTQGLAPSQGGAPMGQSSGS